MTSQPLKLTHKEVENLINNRFDDERFEVTFDDIPMYHKDHVIAKGETHRDYTEDDGREFRWFIFTDKVTGLEHHINYTYHKDWPNDIFDIPDSIEVVEKKEESDIYVAPKPVVEPEVILSPEEQADKDLWNRYLAVEPECTVVIPKEKLKVPSATIKEVLRFIKEEKYNARQLRAVVIPLCIEYKFEHASFWKWIQVKRKVWKA
jgi:hypothetical protein